MKCESCGRRPGTKIFKRGLLDRELPFCSARCAAVFDRIFPGTAAGPGVRGRAAAVPGGAG